MAKESAYDDWFFRGHDAYEPEADELIDGEYEIEFNNDVAFVVVSNGAIVEVYLGEDDSTNRLTELTMADMLVIENRVIDYENA